ncbi:hypothetical protein AB835_14410 [Candidatus Endobugula sertula]|uniref:Uncharacterized protein n=1 Tax=Candidatus Endobugula sertula TaxID=62101 RepID=A0A1D2QLE0_9GAMM|nr:hypothetical protein AB835_14410 [Candidatus Endobugula sertula]
MEKNFTIEQAISINCEDQNFDLHNCYDFKELKFEVATKTVILAFELNKSISGLDGSATSITFKFTGIDHFELSPQFANYVNHELSEMGYKNPDDTDYDWLVDESKSTNSDHIFFRLANDEYIRLHSCWAVVSTQP